MGCSEVLGDIGSIFYMKVAHKILFEGENERSVDTNKNLTQPYQRDIAWQEKVGDKTGNVWLGPKREGP